MLLDVIDNKIRQAFSDAALEYDVLTSLHKEIGRELMKKVLNAQESDAILDIGMGTGWLTSKLKFYFPESKVVGIDFAEGMIDYANKQYEGFDILQANALALPFKENTFDVIVSNLAYQWVRDLQGSFELCHRSLKKEGEFKVTMFGRETFKELFEALEHAHQGKLSIERLRSVDEVEDALKACGLKDITVDYERIKVRFPDMIGLVKWIRDIGANGLPKQMYFGKELMNRANQYYEGNFKDKFGVYTTFEVIWVQAKK